MQGVSTRDAERPDLAAVAVDVFSASRNDRAMVDLTSRINIEPGVAVVRREQAR